MCSNFGSDGLGEYWGEHGYPNLGHPDWWYFEPTDINNGTQLDDPPNERRNYIMQWELITRLGLLGGFILTMESIKFVRNTDIQIGHPTSGYLNQVGAM